MRSPKTAAAVLASAALFFLLAASVLPNLESATTSPRSPDWLGEALWTERGLDLLVQAFLLLAGVLAIVLLLREEPRGRTP